MLKGEQMKIFTPNSIIVKALKTFAILLLATLFAFALQGFGLRVENILMLYVLGILIVIIETKNYLWGILSSIICIFAFNYFFTEPKYTFRVKDPNYIISFTIFLVVAFIVSTLTSRLQKQIIISKQNEEMASRLYKISSGYLNITEIDNIIAYGVENLELLIGKACAIFYGEAAYASNDSAVIWSFKNSLACGAGENFLGNLSQKYLPIKNKSHTIGVLSVDCRNGDITKEESLCINTMLSQITMAIERELLNIAEEKNRLNIEKETLRSNLLRSISHDLRTPLTAIRGGSGFLIDSYKSLDAEMILSLLNGINTDAAWLSNMVENLLNMTRIQDGKLLLNQQNEVIDDIIGEAVSRVSKTAGNHTIKTDITNEIMLVPMDGQLIIQVLINLLDNAIKHTASPCEILLKTEKVKSDIVFTVSDNGGGIKEELLNQIFESFVTETSQSTDAHRGMGLGLSICKSIIQAHGGTISANNNEIGGATFQFTLPLERTVMHDG